MPKTSNPIILMKVGTIGKGKDKRINHIACVTWDADSVDHLNDTNGAGEPKIPNCFLTDAATQFVRIIQPDDDILVHTKSKYNRGARIADMEKAEPFAAHVEALLTFLKGKTIAAFNAAHVRGSLNLELTRLGLDELPNSMFTKVSPRLTEVFKKETSAPANRQMNTYAEHFGVAHPQHAAKRCNATIDVEVLAKVYSHLVALEHKHGIRSRISSDASAMASLGLMRRPAAAATCASTLESKDSTSAYKL